MMMVVPLPGLLIISIEPELFSIKSLQKTKPIPVPVSFIVPIVEKPTPSLIFFKLDRLIPTPVSCINILNNERKNNSLPLV